MPTAKAKPVYQFSFTLFVFMNAEGLTQSLHLLVFEFDIVVCWCKYFYILCSVLKCSNFSHSVQYHYCYSRSKNTGTCCKLHKGITCLCSLSGFLPHNRYCLLFHHLKLQCYFWYFKKLSVLFVSLFFCLPEWFSRTT